MMLYPKNEFPFQEAQFQNPDSEYRGTPFWAWNCYMTKEKISMTGERISSAAAITAFAISIFSTLNAPTAYPPFCASESIFSDVTNGISLSSFSLTETFRFCEIIVLYKKNIVNLFCKEN